MDKTLRVLHLEDDPDFSTLVQAMLAQEGVRAELVPVPDYPSFLSALEGETYDVILADYLLPGGNGFEALGIARQKCPETPVLMISGTLDEQAASRSLESGATDYVLKNGLERLVPAIRRAASEAHERKRRQHAESELVRRERYFRTLTENSLDVLTILDATGMFQYNSASLKTVLGYDPNELAGRCAFDLVHPEDLAGVMQSFERASRNPSLRVTQEFRFRHQDGSWRWLEAVGQNRLADPEIAGLVINSRDISDRKRAAAEVSESARRYRLIFDGNPIPMWVSDLETFAFLEVNEAAARHYGYSREEFLARTSKEIHPPEEVEKLEQYFERHVRQQRLGNVGRSGPWRHRKKNGVLIEVEITWSIIAYQGGKGVLTMIHDVTERKRTERREAALSRLGRGLSSATSVKTAAHFINEVAEDLFTFNRFALGLYDPKTDTVRPVLKVENLEGQRTEIMVERLRDQPDAIVRRVMEHGTELLLDAGPSAQCTMELFHPGEGRPAASQIYASVRNGENVIGLLSLQSATPRTYDQQDLNALQLLADHCAGALERIHAEHLLRESEQRFRELFEGSPDAIVVADLNGQILDVNPAAAQLWGTSVRRLVGGDIRSLAPAPGSDELLANLGQLVAGGTGQFESQIRTLDERDLPTEVSGNCIEYGQKQALLLHFRDISERRQAAEALRNSEASLAAAQRIAHVGSWELDLADPEKIHRNELQWSDETYRIFGLKPRERPVTVEWFLDHVHPEDRQRVADQAERAFREGGAFDTEHRIVRADGRKRMVRCRAEVAFDAQGKLVRLCGIVVDVTERRHLEEQLRQAQKMEAIGQLAGGVAHDFNNILTVIHGHGSLLQENKELTPVAATSARQITQAAERAAALTRQLLAFSRRQVMQPRRLDLNELVSNMTMMLGRVLGEQVALNLNYSPHPVFIQADVSMIEQVLLNLAINARDAMPKGGQLAVKISVNQFAPDCPRDHAEARAGEFACLSVVDSGCGIAPENLRRIFEPFFTTKEVGKGTGLGLATAYGIVKQHQGWIEVQSTLGHGTTFRVFLPLAGPANGDSESPVSPPPARGGRETILVVEDEGPVRELVCSILEQHGYRVLQAESGVQALALWQNAAEHVDLLLTDLVMPDRVNGRELAGRMRAARPALKVVFTSGYSADVVGKDFVLQRGLCYLQKPYDPRKLVATVRDCLDQELN